MTNSTDARIVVTARRHGHKPIVREFDTPTAARAWMHGLTLSGWIVRRETEESR